jgi:hypothetical protein
VDVAALDTAASLTAAVPEAVALLRRVIADDSIEPGVRVEAAGEILACLREPIPLDLGDDQ